ncbi:MAG TPA: S9 family peptidase [Thermomicrobiales bacterium]|nr:S9 family peptidase [Thermomicrobiales bacterium]
MTDEQRPIDIQDAINQRAPSGIAMSPDGSRVVFSLGPIAKKGEYPEADLWLAETDGSGLRRLTTGESSDGQARWSPDGSLIAFISDREKRGTGALYVISPDGGEAVRVSQWDANIASPVWSPDGAKVAVLATDPETEDEKKRKEERDDTYVHQEDEKLARLAVVELQADPLGQPALVAVEPKRLLEGEWNVWQHDWSPDGERIAVVVSRHLGFGEGQYGLSLGLVPAGGGELTVVGGESPSFRAPGSVAWSPDGAQLAFLAAFDLKRDAGHALYLVDAADPASVRELARDEGFTALSLAWPLADHLALLRLKSVYSNVVTLMLDGETVEPLFHGEQQERGAWSTGMQMTPLGLGFSADGGRFAAIWGDSTRPAEVWAGVVGAAPRQLTRFNADLATRALGRTELVRWAAEGGLEIEGLLIYPVGYEEGKAYPTILHVHGGPSWAWDDHFYANWHDMGQYLAGHGYAVLMPNPRGSTGRGWEFQIANHNDWMGADYRDSQAGLDQLIERGIADPERLGVGGWSYGGLTTAWTITQTNRFKAAIVGAGVTNRTSMQGTTDIVDWAGSWMVAEFAEDTDAYWHTSAMRYVGQVATPTLVLHGGNDTRVPVSQGWEMYNALKTMGVPTKMVVYPREPHGIGEYHHQRDLLERVLGWFDQYVKG